MSGIELNSLEEELELLSLSDDAFADGIANMIRYVMANKKQPVTVNQSFTSPQTQALLLEDNTSMDLE